MKEIKAYIQRCCVNDVVDDLQRAGAPGITLVEIHPVGYGYEPNYFRFDSKDVFKRYGYLRIVKLEIVCADCDVSRLAQTIRSRCCTGSNGDGWIFVTEVTMGIRIRDSATGEAALAQERRASRATP